MLTIKPTHEEEVVLRSLKSKLTRATYKHFEQIFNKKKVQTHKTSSTRRSTNNKFETIVSAIDEELDYLPDSKNHTVQHARKSYGRAKGGLIGIVILAIAIPVCYVILAQTGYLGDKTILRRALIVTIAAVLGIAMLTRQYFHSFKGDRDREGRMTDDIMVLQEVKDSCRKLS